MNSDKVYSKATNILPFLLNDIDRTAGVYLSKDNKKWVYSSKTQTTNMIELMMQSEIQRNGISCTGYLFDTTPATKSTVGSTTGLIPPYDSDEANDDSGSD